MDTSIAQQLIDTYHVQYDGVTTTALHLASGAYAVLLPGTYIRVAATDPRLVVLGRAVLAQQQRQADASLAQKCCTRYPAADPESLRRFGAGRDHA